ncbi:thioredoxin domain-containing protein 8 isoform X4 [Homo sapiens]|uniref:thioredoxin domain-containing protein 8 isoform X4 n=1 Tax=Homo sapiens TaxID=9606 RepID=UPI0007DC7BB9|nr:thioredoxin domain-containing protein 8 isoform X4 [Homo sapiens]XP_054218587.1 thioredoxin domain-containing protein 8 isoform X4 [Homo sapiens]|eukprot:XP_016870072.1 thioredoxin domain-containing protein 8 isoform X5 [Homo sapiens]
MVQIIKDTNEFKTFLTAAGHKLAVVQFSSKRCGPCKRMFPVFHAMSVKYQNVFFANVDVNNSPELAETCHIKTIPTFQMFKKSQKIFEFCGADAKKLEAKTQELINPVSGIVLRNV